MNDFKTAAFAYLSVLTARARRMLMDAAEACARDAIDFAPEGTPPRTEPRLKDSIYAEAFAPDFGESGAAGASGASDAAGAAEVLAGGVGRLGARVVADNPHAAFVEFGTGRRGAASGAAGVAYDPDWPGMPAQPYLSRAADAARARGFTETR